MGFERYSYIFTDTFEADIEGIVDYIATELANPDAAGSFLDELEVKLNDICKTPGIGRVVENEFLKRNDVHRFLVGNYIAYYLIDQNKHRVVLLRIVYGKRNQDKILKDI